MKTGKPRNQQMISCESMYCKRENSRIFTSKTLSGERVTTYGYKSDILTVLLKAKFFTKFFTLSPAGVCLGLRGSQKECTFSAKRGKFQQTKSSHPTCPCQRVPKSCAATDLISKICLLSVRSSPFLLPPSMVPVRTTILSPPRLPH